MSIAKIIVLACLWGSYAAATSIVEATQKLMEEGEKHIILSDDYRNATMVLGNSGAGKSAFIQWLIGDNSKLEAKEVMEGTGEFIIEDGQKIGSSTIQSKTKYPEFLIDNMTNIAYYDCPGFGDTRGISYDVASAHFIKLVANHAEQVKLIFVVSYPSVRKGVDRYDFMKLLRHSTTLVRDIGKFNESIALVVTKVDNRVIQTGYNYTLISDSNVILSIALFLMDVKADLLKELRRNDVQSSEKVFADNASKFIDILLKKSGKVYSRIGIFRRPIKSGPLSEISLLQNGRKKMIEILNSSIRFSSKSDSDFGYSISEKSKNDIRSLINAIHIEIKTGITDINKNVREHYEFLYQKFRLCLNYTYYTFQGNDYCSKAHGTVMQLIDSTHALSDLVKEMRKMDDFTKLPEIIFSTVTNKLGIRTTEIVLSKILRNINFYIFLQKVAGKTFDIKAREWSDVFTHPQRGAESYAYSEKTSLESKINSSLYDTQISVLLSVTELANVLEFHISKAVESLSISKMHSQLDKVLDVLQNTCSECSIDELLGSGKEISESLGCNSCSYEVLGLFSKISQQKSFLRFLCDLSGEGSSILCIHMDWKNTFESLRRFILESKRWYQFLSSLFERFSEYHVQKHKAKYDVADLEDWGTHGKLRGLSITETNFLTFLRKVQHYNLVNHENVAAMRVTSGRLKELNAVLEVTLKTTLEKQCPQAAPDTVIIRGDFVIFTDFVNDEGKIMKPFLCSGDQPRHINIFALNKVFFDTDVNRKTNESRGYSNDPAYIAVVAPKWEIIDIRKVVVDGHDGASHTPAQANYYSDRDGSDGKPGLPGGAGGSFFGAAMEIRNSNSLTINANGGHGGPGQGGADGGWGRNGDLMEDTCGQPGNAICYEMQKDDNSEYNCERKRKYMSFFQNIFVCGFGLTNSDCDKKICDYTVLGKYNALEGYEGGNAGAGGFGGNSGNITIVSDTSALVCFEAQIGQNGSNGDHGKKINGLQAICKCFHDTKLFKEKTEEQLRSLSTWYEKLGSEVRYTKYYDVSRLSLSSRKNMKTYNQKDIEQPYLPPSHNITNVIIAYKSFVIENYDGSRGRYNQITLNAFMKFLNSNDRLRKMQLTTNFVEELEELEQRQQYLKPETLRVFYDSLRERVHRFAIEHVSADKETKKVLSYTYTAILCQMYRLEVELEPTMVVEISKFLNLVQRNAQEFNILQEKNIRIAVQNEHNNKYLDEINNKIEEADYFITTHVSPEMDRISAEIDKNVEILLNETLRLQERALKNKKQLDIKQRDLQNTLILKHMFGVFKFVGQVTSCLGPFGVATGAVIGITGSVAEAFVLNDQENGMKTFEMPAGVSSNLDLLSNHIKESSKKKIASFNSKLELISQQLSSHSSMSDISEKVKTSKNKINNMIELDGIDLDVFAEIEKHEKLLAEEIGAKETMLMQQSLDDDVKHVEKTSTAAIKVIGKVKQMVEIGSSVLDIYNSHKDNEEKQKAVRNAMRQTGEKFEKLKQFEARIHNLVFPMLREMKSGVEGFKKRMKTQSNVALEVSKWQLQSSLKNVKLYMEKFTQGFQMQSSFLQCFEKMEEAISLYIMIYDHIQRYQEQQTLATYISNINSQASHNIDVTDNRVKEAIRRLDEMIKSNLIRKQYEIAVNAVKQWVFPFAHMYIQQFALPKEIQGETSSQNLINNVTQGIENMQKTIHRYHSAIVVGLDGCIHNEEFHDKYISSVPFFEWKNAQFKNEIRNLLAGRKVLVYADILKSPPGKDAIKFNRIAINFKADNSTLQREIDAKLNYLTVEATHMGNSFFRFHEKFYKMTGSKITLRYSFEKDENGIPVRRNTVYNKLQSGDFMLSPYAWWEMQLIKAEKSFSFYQLSEYSDKVDLQLLGHGNYVSMEGDNPLIVKDIDDYYTADESVFKLSYDLTNLVSNKNETM